MTAARLGRYIQMDRRDRDMEMRLQHKGYGTSEEIGGDGVHPIREGGGRAGGGGRTVQIPGSTLGPNMQ